MAATSRAARARGLWFLRQLRWPCALAVAFLIITTGFSKHRDAGRPPTPSDAQSSGIAAKPDGTTRLCPRWLCSSEPRPTERRLTPDASVR